MTELQLLRLHFGHEKIASYFQWFNNVTGLDYAKEQICPETWNRFKHLEPSPRRDIYFYPHAYHRSHGDFLLGDETLDDLLSLDKLIFRLCRAEEDFPSCGLESLIWIVDDCLVKAEKVQ